MQSLKFIKLPVYLTQAISQRLSRILRGKRGIGLSLLPSGILASFALSSPGLIGDGASHGFLNC